MKLLPTFLTASALLFAAPLFAASESVTQVMEDAQRAYASGDMATAKKDFQIVVELDPKNTTARNYLRNIQAREALQPRSGDIEKQFANIILPKVEFKEATLGSVFDYLRQQVPKVTNGKTNVNFVLAVPDTQLTTQAVTLQLTNIPFTETLRYLADLAALQIEYQKYAIKVSPKGAGAVAAPVAASSDAPAK